MATMVPKTPTHTRQRDDSIGVSLQVLEQMLDQACDRMFDNLYFDEVDKELRRLHARIRIHHAEDHLGCDEKQLLIPPELAEEFQRLRAEHSTIIGLLDRLIRSADSMADRTLEDKEVFFLRGREFIAMLRRHEAEEDRLFYLSVWRETGGES